MRQDVTVCWLAGLVALGAAAPAWGDHYPGVEAGSFYSPSMRRTIPYNIYLPPDYHQSSTSYPVVYWLHGILQDQNAGLPVTKYLDEGIRAGHVPPMILVLGTDGMRAATLYKDNPDLGLFGETVIIDELIPYIEAHYRTLAAQPTRAIEGFSVGGQAAMFFTAKHLDLFSSVLTVGGDMMDADFYDYTADNADYLREHMPIQLVVGTLDFLTFDQNVAFNAWLDGLDIPHGWEILPFVFHDVPCYYDQLKWSTMAFHAQHFGP